MAKDTRTLKLEIAGELLKLEAKLEAGLRPTIRTTGDREAMESIRSAHDSLLKTR